jgi:ATP sulfurylase
MDEALGRSPKAAPGTVLLSGRVGLYTHLRSQTRHYQLSPSQTRTLFQARGWRRILGDWWLDGGVAQARQQRQAMDHASCDGLFIQALIEEDAAAADALRACEAAVEAAHRRDTVLIAALAGCRRPDGVRGLLFGALVRLNFGCTHVRLDAGVTATEREALKRLEALGIELIAGPGVPRLDDETGHVRLREGPRESSRAVEQ